MLCFNGEETKSASVFSVESRESTRYAKSLIGLHSSFNKNYEKCHIIKCNCQNINCIGNSLIFIK